MVLFPFTEQNTTMKNVNKPQSMATRLYCIPEPLAVVRLDTALPERDNPIKATVGPMTTAGISLEIHFVPTNLTTNAMIT